MNILSQYIMVNATPLVAVAANVAAPRKRLEKLSWMETKSQAGTRVGKIR